MPWCKIAVTVREFFGTNSLKITVTVSVFNCFGINMVIMCCFTVTKQVFGRSAQPSSVLDGGVAPLCELRVRNPCR